MNRINRIFWSAIMVLSGVALASCQKTPVNEQLPTYCNDYLTFTDLVSDDMRELLGGVNRYNFSTVTSQVSLEFEVNNPSETIDLNGIQCFQNLTSITLVGQSFRDISPLATLINLQQIRLIDTNIVSIDALKNLSKVNELTISNAQLLQNVKGVEQMTKLRALDLSGNGIVTIEELNNLVNLEDLVLSHNKIKYIPPISQLTKLKYLDLSYNEIEEFSGDLTGLVNLEILNASHNHITDLSPLDDLEKIITLDLSSNRLGLVGTDISPDFSSLTHATQLTNLYLDNNLLTSISGLSVIQSPIEVLHLQSNYITDISPIAHLSTLKDLGLKENRIMDLPVMDGWNALEDLDLSNNRLTDFSALLDITSLVTLNLSYNGITSIPTLEGQWENLTELNLHANSLDDTSGLSGHDTLETVVLTNNGLHTLSGIQFMDSLKSLIIDRVSEEESPYYVDEIETTPNQIEHIVDSFNALTSFTLMVDQSLYLPFSLGNSLTIEGSFNDIPDLKTVNLIGLNVSLIDEHSFHSLTIENLFLDNNQLSDLSFIQYIPSLLEVSANENSILDLSVFSGFNNLEYISLKGIEGLQIVEDAFIDLPNLKVINLESNELTSISNSFVRLPKLTELYIDSQQMTSIEASFIDIFTRLPASNGLDFSSEYLVLIADSFNATGVSSTYGTLMFGGFGETGLPLQISNSFNGIHATNLVINATEYQQITGSINQSNFSLIQMVGSVYGMHTEISTSFNDLNMGNDGYLHIDEIDIYVIKDSFNRLVSQSVNFNNDITPPLDGTRTIENSFVGLSVSGELSLKNFPIATVESSFNDIESLSFLWTNEAMNKIETLTTVNQSFNNLKVTQTISLLNNSFNQLSHSFNDIETINLVMFFNQIMTIEDGFENTSVELLNLSYNYLQDLDTLSAISKVNNLDLSFNSLTTVSFLDGISPTTLMSLDISNQRDEDGNSTLTTLDGLNNMPSLVNLNFEGNAITSIDGLNGLGITNFLVPLNTNHNTFITNVSPTSFNNLSLTILDLTVHPIEDLSFLLNIEEVETLNLHITKDERTVLETLPYQETIQMLSLTLTYPLDNFAFLVGYENLDALSLNGEEQTTIYGLSGLPNLSILHLEHPENILSISSSFNAIPSLELNSTWFQQMTHLESVTDSFDAQFNGDTLVLLGTTDVIRSFPTIRYVELITSDASSTVLFDAASFPLLNSIYVSNWNIESFAWTNDYEGLSTILIDQLSVNITDLSDNSITEIHIGAIDSLVTSIDLTIHPDAIVLIASDNALTLAIETNTLALTAELENSDVTITTQSNSFEIGGSLSSLEVVSELMATLTIGNLFVEHTFLINSPTLDEVIATQLTSSMATTMDVQTSQTDLRLDYNVGTLNVTSSTLTAVHLNGTATSVYINGPQVALVNRFLVSSIATNLSVETEVTTLFIDIPQVTLIIQGDNLSTLNLTNTGTKTTSIYTLVDHFDLIATANNVIVNATNATTLHFEDSVSSLTLNTPQLITLSLESINVERDLVVNATSWDLEASNITDSSVDLTYLVNDQIIRMQGETLDSNEWVLSSTSNHLQLDLDVFDINNWSYTYSSDLTMIATDLEGSDLLLDFEPITITSSASELSATQLNFKQSTNTHNFATLVATGWEFTLSDTVFLTSTTLDINSMVWSYNYLVVNPIATEGMTYNLSASGLKSTGVTLDFDYMEEALIHASTLGSATFTFTTNLAVIDVDVATTSPTTFNGNFANATELSILLPTTRTMNLTTPVITSLVMNAPQATINQSMLSITDITLDVISTTLNLTAPNLMSFEIIDLSTLTTLRLVGSSVIESIELNQSTVGTLTIDNSTSANLSIHADDLTQLTVTTMVTTNLTLVAPSALATLSSTASSLMIHGQLSTMTLTGNALTDLQLSDTTKLTNFTVTAHALADFYVPESIIDQVTLTTNVTTLTVIAPHVSALSLISNAVTTLSLDVGGHDFAFTSTLSSPLTMTLVAHQVNLTLTTTQLTLTDETVLDSLTITATNLSELTSGTSSISTLNLIGTNVNLSVTSNGVDNLNVTKLKANAITLNVTPETEVSIQHEGTTTLTVTTETTSIDIISTRSIFLNGTDLVSIEVTTPFTLTLNSGTGELMVGGTINNLIVQNTNLTSLDFMESTTLISATIDSGNLSLLDFIDTGLTTLILSTSSTSLNLTGTSLTSIQLTANNLSTLTFDVEDNAQMAILNEVDSFLISGTLSELELTNSRLTTFTINQATINQVKVNSSPLSIVSVTNSTITSMELDSSSNSISINDGTLKTLSLHFSEIVFQQASLNLHDDAVITINSLATELSLQGTYHQVDLTANNLLQFTNTNQLSGLDIYTMSPTVDINHEGTDLTLTYSGSIPLTLTTDVPTITYVGTLAWNLVSSSSLLTLLTDKAVTLLTDKTIINVTTGASLAVNSTQTMIELTTNAASLTLLKDMDTKVITALNALSVTLEGNDLTLQHNGITLFTLTTNASTITYEGTSPWKVISSIDTLTLNSDVEVTVQTSALALSLTTNAPKITHIGGTTLSVQTDQTNLTVNTSAALSINSDQSSLVLTTTSSSINILKNMNVQIITALNSLNVTLEGTAFTLTHSGDSLVTLTTDASTITYEGTSPWKVISTFSALTLHTEVEVTVQSTAASLSLTTNAPKITHTGASLLTVTTNQPSLEIVYSGSVMLVSTGTSLNLTTNALFLSILSGTTINVKTANASIEISSTIASLTIESTRVAGLTLKTSIPTITYTGLGTLSVTTTINQMTISSNRALIISKTGSFELTTNAPTLTYSQGTTLILHTNNSILNVTTSATSISTDSSAQLVLTPSSNAINVQWTTYQLGNLEVIRSTTTPLTVTTNARTVTSTTSAPMTINTTQSELTLTLPSSNVTIASTTLQDIDGQVNQLVISSVSSSEISLALSTTKVTYNGTSLFTLNLLGATINDLDITSSVFTTINDTQPSSITSLKLTNTHIDNLSGIPTSLLDTLTSINLPTLADLSSISVLNGWEGTLFSPFAQSDLNTIYYDQLLEQVTTSEATTHVLYDTYYDLEVARILTIFRSNEVFDYLLDDTLKNQIETNTYSSESAYFEGYLLDLEVTEAELIEDIGQSAVDALKQSVVDTLLEDITLDTLAINSSVTNDLMNQATTLINQVVANQTFTLVDIGGQ